MFTQIVLDTNFAGSPSGAEVGSKITGSTSGATGFVHSAVNNLIQLINVTGSFNTGENLISTSQTSAQNANLFIENSSNSAVEVSSVTTRTFDKVKQVFIPRLLNPAAIIFAP